MAINTTQKEEAAEGSNATTVTANNDLDFPTSARQGEAFYSLQSALAAKGYVLQRTAPSDGPVTFWAERWGLAKHLCSIDEVCRFLEQIGGRL